MKINQIEQKEIDKIIDKYKKYKIQAEITILNTINGKIILLSLKKNKKTHHKSFKTFGCLIKHSLHEIDVYEQYEQYKLRLKFEKRLIYKNKEFYDNCTI